MQMTKTILSLAIISALCGCATDTRRVANSQASAASEQIQGQQAEFRKALTEADSRRVAAQDVPRPFIAGNVVPLARSLTMPEQVRQNVTAMFRRDPVDLATALQQLSQASGMLISATPDALLPPAAFGPRLATQATPASVQGPARIVLNAEAKPPLWALLDDVARQAQVSWRPVAQGVEFYRVDTRVFSLSAIPQTATTSASLGRNGSSNAAFEAQSKTSFTTLGQSQMAGLQSAIDAMLSQSGKAIISQENQTLIVTDTTEALARVETFVREQNKIMSSRVRVMFEIIEVIDKDASDVGVDWTALYSSVNRSLSLTPATGLTSTLAGSLGLTRKTGDYAGSNLAVQALSEIGFVASHTSVPALTTSGRPFGTAVRSTFSYVDSVQAVPTVSSSVLTSTTTQAPTVTQKDETVGTFVTVVPTAKPDGTIFVSLSFDKTSAQPLIPFSVGSGDSKLTVQQKTIDGAGIIQEFPVRSGQTIVVGGIESLISQDTVRRLFKGAPLLSGGGDASKLTKSRMVLLLTAVAEEGI